MASRKKNSFIVTVMPFLSGKLNSNKAYHKYVTMYTYSIGTWMKGKNVELSQKKLLLFINRKAHVENLSCESNDLMDFYAQWSSLWYTQIQMTMAYRIFFSVTNKGTQNLICSIDRTNKNKLPIGLSLPFIHARDFFCVLFHCKKKKKQRQIQKKSCKKVKSGRKISFSLAHWTVIENCFSVNPHKKIVTIRIVHYGIRDMTYTVMQTWCNFGIRNWKFLQKKPDTPPINTPR